MVRYTKGRPKALDEVLENSAGGLGSLLQQARRLAALKAVLDTFLEPQMTAQVQVAAVHDHVLVLVTPSASLATRLRMDADSLIKAFGRTGYRRLESIQVRIAPLPVTRHEQRTARQMPEAGRRSLERFASDHEDLALDLHWRKPED